MTDSKLLAFRLGISQPKLRNALTHSSFYESKEQEKGNSRLIFLGMFGFKGKVALLLQKYYSGSGTQLQHALGNLFTNERLNRLFDEWGLKKWVRAGANFDVNAHKHIFVFAVLGCMAELNDEACNKQIMRIFLNDKNENVLTHRKKNRDIQSQADILARTVLGSHLQLKMEVLPEGLHKAMLCLENGLEIASAVSKSYRYAKKKVGKEALRIISNLNLRHFEETTDYYERLQKRINEEKQKHQESVRQKNEEREKARLIRKEKVKRLKEIQDEKRRLAKLEAKKRTAEKEKQAAQAAAKSQRTLSAKKRRHLEDKKK